MGISVIPLQGAVENKKTKERLYLMMAIALEISGKITIDYVAYNKEGDVIKLTREEVRVL